MNVVVVTFLPSLSSRVNWSTLSALCSDSFTSLFILKTSITISLIHYWLMLSLQQSNLLLFLINRVESGGTMSTQMLYVQKKALNKPCCPYNIIHYAEFKQKRAVAQRRRKQSKERILSSRLFNTKFHNEYRQNMKVLYIASSHKFPLLCILHRSNHFPHLLKFPICLGIVLSMDGNLFLFLLRILISEGTPLLICRCNCALLHKTSFNLAYLRSVQQWCDVNCFRLSPEKISHFMQGYFEIAMLIILLIIVKKILT